MDRAELTIERTWDGEPARTDECARIVLDLSEAGLDVEVDAPFHGDPPPSAPVGSTDRLWEYEVVELFLLGEDERYLELELGPHGHYLALALRGPRHVEESGLAIRYEARREASRWTGRATVLASQLPPALHASNAYAIHGQGSARRYLAAHPVPGTEPDFHRLHFFQPLAWS